jgi:hypothetical protein
MFPARSIVGFCVRFILIYGLLIAPWPGLEGAYAKFFRAGGGFLFESFGSKGKVIFEPYSQKDVADTTLTLVNRKQIGPDGQAPAWWTHISSRYSGYLDAVFVVSLILATPIPWSRKSRALFLGVILIHLFIILKLATAILYAYNNNQYLGVIKLNSLWASLLDHTYQGFLRNNLESGLVAAVLIWILVTFRREDWPKTLAEKAPAEEKKRPRHKPQPKFKRR